MLTRLFRTVFLIVTLLVSVNINTNGQETPLLIHELNEQIERQETEIQSLNNRLNNETSTLKEQISSYSPMALVLFLFGSFCALWAQNTGRNAWWWFFAGLLLSVFAVIDILIINSREE